MEEEIEVLELEDSQPETFYKDYIEESKNTIKQTTKDNSIILDFKLEEAYCYTKITKFEIDGSNKIIKDTTFTKEKDFIKELLEPILKIYSQQNKIVINTVTPEKEERSVLKVISETNDMFVVTGLDLGEATRLLELVKIIQSEKNKETSSDFNYQQKIDERGVGNVVGMLLSLTMIGLVLLSLILSNFLK